MRKLKTAMFLSPALILILSFLMIALSFHIAMQKYLHDLVRDEIHYELDFFDRIYQGGDFPEEMEIGEIEKMQELEDEEKEIIIVVKNMIMDETFGLLIPNLEWAAPQEIKSAQQISQYLKINSDSLQGDRIMRAQMEGKSYFFKVKQYMGVLKDGYIQKGDRMEKENGSGTDPKSAPSDEQMYYAVVYCDVSAIENLLLLLNQILFIILGVSGVLSLLLILNRARRLDRSFQKLKFFILQTGARERNRLEKTKDNALLPAFDYLEFEELGRSVVEMDEMIEQSEKSQIQFFQNASHELRTPLMSIQGYAEGLKEGVISDEKKALDVIIQESAKMSELVNEILYLSKLSATTPKFEKVDLQELLYECAEEVQGVLQKKKIRLIDSLGFDGILKEEQGEALWIFADEKALKRAIGNILSNATRYAKTQIAMELLKEDDLIKISITDDGEGISPEDIEHIFERFYKGKGGKFGIGLSITKHIVEQHGGYIEVFSEEGLTRFTISLPQSCHKVAHAFIQNIGDFS